MNMNEYPQLPDSEFAIMQIIWGETTPVSKTRIAEAAAPLRGWKPQTVYTLLTRLQDKGFISSQKQGKERVYTPLIARNNYLNQETGRFVRTFHENSITGLMNAMFAGTPDEDDLSELERWLNERK